MKTLKEALFSRRNLNSNNIIEFKNSKGEVWKFKYNDEKDNALKVGTDVDYVLLDLDSGRYIRKMLILNKGYSLYSNNTEKFFVYNNDVFTITNSKWQTISFLELKSNELDYLKEWLKEHF